MYEWDSPTEFVHDLHCHKSSCGPAGFDLRRALSGLVPVDGQEGYVASGLALTGTAVGLLPNGLEEIPLPSLPAKNAVHCPGAPVVSFQQQMVQEGGPAPPGGAGPAPTSPHRNTYLWPYRGHTLTGPQALCPAATCLQTSPEQALLVRAERLPIAPLTGLSQLDSTIGCGWTA
eukprot:CAMPEP_0174366398 /NCGR_PEP_ID=MMETSP0811_2-20130205/81056_1 /TAXON_ID=73025 ORGANISM="Eutreptiella gymnastica-like, Strain CCMP1594" /NCGR_SAMPLE_ID=MMETSP0811_2 /ASSEMBLY_ACC=CAM_ASM_000667 /LENGTH=173 /DNA_ID=CAMNT_0015507913 /DNA_START=353 /DNA_END=873 /DNA_ORIENTATION=+